MQIGYGADENVLYLEDDKLYRHVPLSPHERRWHKTANFIQSDVFAELQHLGYVPRHTFVSSTDTHHIYEVEQCWPLIRCDVTAMRNLPEFPCNEILAEQALAILKAVCKINLILIECHNYHQYGDNMLLWELHPWNFTFQCGQPILLDIGAFDHTVICDPAIVRQCIRMTAKRFNMGSLCDCPTIPVSLRDWYKLSEIIAATTIQHEQSTWQDYTHPAQCQEVSLLSQLIEKVHPNTILDVGGGDGSLSSSIAPPQTHIICIDDCRPALGRGYQTRHGLIDFACVDICSPYKHTTCDIELTASWVQRFRCDMLFASSIIHHLLRKMDIESIAALFNDLARNQILVEFISHTDPHVSWYGPEVNFDRMKAALPNWRITHEIAKYEAEPCKDHRTWYLLERL